MVVKTHVIAGPHGGFFGIQNLIQFQRDPLDFLTKTARDFGDIAYFRMAAFHFYLINNPDYVYELLISQASKIEKWRRQTDTWSLAVGASTLTLEGETWKRHRKLLNPTFHSQNVKRYLDVIIDHTERLLRTWKPGEIYEMMFEMMRLTMGIIADIIFSLRDIEKEAYELNRALTSVFEVLTARTTAFQQLPLWMPTRDNRRIHQASKVIGGFIHDLIRKRRADSKDYGDILSDLINARDDETGEILSDDEIANELKTLFGAGHETTALMLMWTLYLLSQNQAEYEKLRKESVQVLGERTPSLADLENMPYVTQVLNESMRIYPPAWSLMVRKANDDLKVGEYTIPKGSVMLIPMWVVHRDPRLFEDPLCFYPERFAGDYRKRYPKYAYFPFGGGPHVCIGSHLAMFEGQIILPMLVRKFNFEYVSQPELKLQALLTLRPKNGLKLRVISP